MTVVAGPAISRRSSPSHTIIQEELKTITQDARTHYGRISACHNVSTNLMGHAKSYPKIKAEFDGDIYYLVQDRSQWPDLRVSSKRLIGMTHLHENVTSAYKDTYAFNKRFAELKERPACTNAEVASFRSELQSIITRTDNLYDVLWLAKDIWDEFFEKQLCQRLQNSQGYSGPRTFEEQSC